MFRNCVVILWVCASLWLAAFFTYRWAHRHEFVAADDDDDANNANVDQMKPAIGDNTFHDIELDDDDDNYFED
jgi:hypothetical protein